MSWFQVLNWPELLFPLYHNDVVPKFCLDRRVCVDWFIHGADREGECSILERSDHRSSRHPPQITLWQTNIKVMKRSHDMHLGKCVNKDHADAVLKRQTDILTNKNKHFFLKGCEANACLQQLFTYFCGDLSNSLIWTGDSQQLKIHQCRCCSGMVSHWNSLSVMLNIAHPMKQSGFPSQDFVTHRKINSSVIKQSVNISISLDFVCSNIIQMSIIKWLRERTEMDRFLPEPRKTLNNDLI